MALLRVQIEEAGSCSRMCRPVEGPLRRRVKERVGNQERQTVEEDGEDDVRATEAGLRASARARASQAGERGSVGAAEPNRRCALCAAVHCWAAKQRKKSVGTTRRHRKSDFGSAAERAKIRTASNNS